MKPIVALVTLLALAACGDDTFDAQSCDGVSGTCKQFLPRDAAALLAAVNELSPNTTLVLGKGTFALDNQLTIRAAGITVAGQGKDVTLLSFASQTSQSNGVDAVGDDFTLRDLTVADAKKDGVRVEDSERVTLRNVKATWTAGPSPSNGAYGLYPVRSQDVLIEGCEAHNASDAGLYVGQVQRAVVRNNVAQGNVAGIEIENCQYADVFGNLAEDNTGGLLIFDLPGNPIAGHDIWVHDNTVQNNNRSNFAPSGVVRQIPAGTGTFAMASRRVEVSGNTYSGNQTTDLAVVSGLIVEADLSKWIIPAAALVGDYTGVELMHDQDGNILNFRSEEIFLHDNHHSSFGTGPDAGTDLGSLMFVVWAGHLPVDAILYDAVGESAFDAANAAGNSNDNHVCIQNETGGSFASLNLPVLSTTFDLDGTYRPAAPYTPFDCEALTNGAVAAVHVPQAP